MTKCKLVHGDCLEKMMDIPTGSIDLVLADPPYGTTSCAWDSVISFEDLWTHLKRIVKTDGAIVLNSAQPFTSLLITSNISMFKYCWVWEKNCPSNIACGKYMPLRYTEDVCVFYKKSPTYNKCLIKRSSSGSSLIKSYQQRGTTFKVSKSEVSSSTSGEVDPNKYSADWKNPSNLIYFGVDRTRKYKHPSKKPVALMEYLIKTYTNEGETVLDFAMGSGTTGVACKNTARNFIGIERDAEYFSLACKRINEC